MMLLWSLAFLHMRDGVQIGFRVQSGDVIKVYIVDQLLNSAVVNPLVLD